HENDYGDRSRRKNHFNQWMLYWGYFWLFTMH
ncbi:hypothetical protein Tsp_01877, partial [Trichinella spiralis]